MVSKIGEYGYAPATTALGLEFLYPKWINPALKAKAKQLATYDPAAARKTFTDGGFTYRARGSSTRRATRSTSRCT